MKDKSPAIERDLSLKEKILESSRHLLATEGYNGLSMRKIAGLVGCKAASIYHHFESKDKIVHALIDEGYQLQYDYILKRIKGMTEPLSRLEARARAFIDFGLENPEFYHIMYVLYTDEMERYPKENYRRNTLNMAGTIEDIAAAAKSGHIDLKEEPEILASAGTAMLHGVVSLFLTKRFHVKLDRERIKDIVVRQAIRLNM